jgi:DNA-binding NarL/FixJ family response regulator
MLAKTILLVDDHGIVRKGCRALLEQEKDITVVGEAEAGQEALEKVEELQPAIVVLDLNLPGLNGIDIIHRLRTYHQPVRIVVLSVYQDEMHVYRALEAGAAAYVVKQGAAEELVDAIEAVATNQRYLSPQIATTLVKSYLEYPSQGMPPEDPPLTLRERDVLQLLVEGLSNRDIAERLQTSRRTVESYRLHIMKKLDLHTVPALVLYALKCHLIELEN